MKGFFTKFTQLSISILPSIYGLVLNFSSYLSISYNLSFSNNEATSFYLKEVHKFIIYYPWIKSKCII